MIRNENVRGHAVATEVTECEPREVTERRPATFVFEGSPPWKGVPIVNGHRILSSQQIDVSISGDGSWPVVTLKLIAPQFLKLILEGDADSGVTVNVADETREALISLGWTPPAPEADAGSAVTTKKLMKDMRAAYLSQASRNLQTGLELPGHGG